MFNIMSRTNTKYHYLRHKRSSPSGIYKCQVHLNSQKGASIRKSRLMTRNHKIEWFTFHVSSKFGGLFSSCPNCEISKLSQIHVFHSRGLESVRGFMPKPRICNRAGPKEERIDIKMPSCQFWDSHHKDKTIWRPFCLYNALYISKRSLCSNWKQWPWLRHT